MIRSAVSTAVWLGSWSTVLLGLAASVLPVVARVSMPQDDTVWAVNMPQFEPGDYQRAVRTLIEAFENDGGEPLVPGDRNAVALKLFTAAGPGLMTPPDLVRALANLLEERGFDRQSISLIGHRELRLRECGYLPWEAWLPRTFEGMPVIAIDSTAPSDPLWSFQSNLPPLYPSRPIYDPVRQDFFETTADDSSFLLPELIEGVDFWINLPMAAHSDAIGVLGSITNASLMAVTNYRRFLASEANGPIAAVEIAAIPEYRQRWRFTILSLERFQFIGSTAFNSRYTDQVASVYLSRNEAALDAIAWELIAQRRQQWGFDTGSRPSLLRFAESVGLGDPDVNPVSAVPGFSPQAQQPADPPPQASANGAQR